MPDSVTAAISGSTLKSADERHEQILDWLETSLSLNVTDLQVASADASFRRYLRAMLADGSTRIVMDAPLEHEDTGSFVQVAAIFLEKGVQVPHVIARDSERGFLLLDDFGSVDYLAAITADPGRADALYSAAIETLVALQAPVPELDAGLPAYDRQLVRRELALFPEWFCQKYLGIHFDTLEKNQWQACVDFIATRWEQMPDVAVHCDYHSRNLMVLSDNTLGVLDFQDAVRGPIAYDVVSLLKDCYIDWPQDQRDRWREQYRQLAISNGLAPGDAESFQQDYELAGIQRHLRIAGVFTRLSIRDGKDRYLSDLPLTLKYLMDALPQVPELEFIRSLLSDRCLPVMR